MLFKISHGQSYSVIFYEKRVSFKKGGGETKFALQVVCLKCQEYRVKNIFFFPESRKLLRYNRVLWCGDGFWCFFSLKEMSEVILSFCGLCSLGPELVIFKLLFRGYHMGLQRYDCFSQM